MHWDRNKRACLCLALLAFGPGGCAVAYDDSAGNRHVVGLVDVVVAHARPDDAVAGNVVGITTFGVLASRNAQGRTLALGYASETTAAIKDNALVLGNPTQSPKQILERNIP